MTLPNDIVRCHDSLCPLHDTCRRCAVCKLPLEHTHASAIPGIWMAKDESIVFSREAAVAIAKLVFEGLEILESKTQAALDAAEKGEGK